MENLIEFREKHKEMKEDEQKHLSKAKTGNNYLRIQPPERRGKMNRRTYTQINTVKISNVKLNGNGSKSIRFNFLPRIKQNKIKMHITSERIEKENGKHEQYFTKEWGKNKKQYKIK